MKKRLHGKGTSYIERELLGEDYTEKRLHGLESKRGSKQTERGPYREGLYVEGTNTDRRLYGERTTQRKYYTKKELHKEGIPQRKDYAKSRLYGQETTRRKDYTERGLYGEVNNYTERGLHGEGVYIQKGNTNTLGEVELWDYFYLRKNHT